MRFLLVVTIQVFCVLYSTHAQGSMTDYNACLEADLLPYSLGGYFAAVTFGSEHTRFRGIVASATKPDIVLPSGFTNNTLQAFALLLDFYPSSDNYSGIWGSTGMVYWNSSIQNKADSTQTTFTNTLLSIGGGYSYYFYKNLYVSPWAGIHIRIVGDKSIPVGNKTFDVPLFNPEASVKIGWCFTLFTTYTDPYPLSH